MSERAVRLWFRGMNIPIWSWGSSRPFEIHGLPHCQAVSNCFPHHMLVQTSWSSRRRFEVRASSFNIRCPGRVIGRFLDISRSSNNKPGCECDDSDAIENGLRADNWNRLQLNSKKRHQFLTFLHMLPHLEMFETSNGIIKVVLGTYKDEFKSIITVSPTHICRTQMEFN